MQSLNASAGKKDGLSLRNSYEQDFYPKLLKSVFQNLHRVNCNDIMAKNNDVMMGLYTAGAVLVFGY